MTNKIYRKQRKTNIRTERSVTVVDLDESPKKSNHQNLSRQKVDPVFKPRQTGQ